MPQTAEHNGGEIDSTDCSDEIWDEVHYHKPPVKVTCRGCGGFMRAKESKLDNRFFSHVGEAAGCPSQGETFEHRQLKSLLAREIRALGWEARLEATPEAADHGGWRADVLAVDPVSGRRTAFEVQLAGMTVETGRERTQKYERDGITTYWVSNKGAWWLWRIPGFLLRVGDDETTRVARGVAHFGEHRRGTGTLTFAPVKYWQPPEDPSLVSLLRDIFDGLVVVHELDYEASLNLEGCHSFRRLECNVMALVTPESLEREKTYLEELNERGSATSVVTREERKEDYVALARQRKEWEDAVAANGKDDETGKYFREFYQSQARVIDAVVPLLQATCGDSDEVLVGIPPRKFSDPGRSSGVAREDGSGWCHVNGDHTTADGALLWVKRGATFGTRIAIVCPNPRFLRVNVDELWRQWGVTLYVETKEQAAVLGSLTSYGPREIVVLHNSR